MKAESATRAMKVAVLGVSIDLGMMSEYHFHPRLDLRHFGLILRFFWASLLFVLFFLAYRLRYPTARRAARKHLQAKARRLFAFLTSEQNFYQHEDGHVARLERKYGVPVELTNLSAIGNTLPRSAKNLDRIACDQDVFFVHLGGIDFCANLPLLAAERALRSVLEEIGRRNPAAFVVVIGIPDFVQVLTHASNRLRIFDTWLAPSVEWMQRVSGFLTGHGLRTGCAPQVKADAWAALRAYNRMLRRELDRGLREGWLRGGCFVDQMKVDMYSPELGQRQQYFSLDGVHLSPEGVSRLVDHHWQQLEPALSRSSLGSRIAAAEPVVRAACGPESHCNGRFFHNGDGRRENVLSHWGKVLASLPRVERWRDAAEVRPATGGFAPVDCRQLVEGQLAYTAIGHASVLLQVSYVNILVDPVWASRVGPWGFGPRRKNQVPFPLERVPKVHVILITHDHYDHLDLETLATLVERDDPIIFCGLGVGKLIARGLAKRGAPRVIELDWWERRAAHGCEFTFVPARHFSGRGVAYNRTLWGGFVVRHGAQRVYFAGDTGYSPSLREIGRRFERIDLAFLPIGCYEPRRFQRDIHLSPAEAIRLHRELSCSKSVAIHFGCFRISAESAATQVDDFRAALARAGLDPGAFVLPAPGQTCLLQSEACLSYGQTDLLSNA